jgi:hypothetical protein
VRPRDRVFVHVRREAPPSDDDVPFWIGTLRTSPGDARESEAVVGSFQGNTEFEMEPAPSREVLSFVVAQGDRASEVLTARGAGTVEVDLHPAGYLVVLPAGGGATGVATAERIEGGLIPFTEEGFGGSPTHAAVRVPLALTVPLGLFPEGPPLRLRRGGIAGGATATVGAPRAAAAPAVAAIRARRASRATPHRHEAVATRGAPSRWCEKDSAGSPCVTGRARPRKRRARRAREPGADGRGGGRGTSGRRGRGHAGVGVGERGSATSLRSRTPP